jgi:hypothetical protein
MANYLIPEGMQEAADRAWALGNLDSQKGRLAYLQAALRWQAENGFDEKVIQDWCDKEFKDCDGTAQRIGFRMGIEYVRRMYLAPEPELIGLDDVMETLLAYLLVGGPPFTEVESKFQAYKRGKASR